MSSAQWTCSYFQIFTTLIDSFDKNVITWAASGTWEMSMRERGNLPLSVSFSHFLSGPIWYVLYQCWLVSNKFPPVPVGIPWSNIWVILQYIFVYWIADVPSSWCICFILSSVDWYNKLLALPLCFSPTISTLDLSSWLQEAPSLTLF